MHISWLGNTAVKLQTKSLEKDIIIVIDPYKQKKGNFPRSLSPNIAVFTRGEKNGITLSQNPFILSTPGECDIQGVLITATEGHEPDHTIIRLDTEQISLAHLGATDKPLTDKQLDIVSDIDILFIGVGGPNSDTYYHHQAVKIINDLEPRIVIPIGYKSDNDPEAKPVEKFLKEMSATCQPEKKVIIKKKDLPNEETRIIVLSKE